MGLSGNTKTLKMSFGSPLKDTVNGNFEKGLSFFQDDTYHVVAFLTNMLCEVENFMSETESLTLCGSSQKGIY